MPINVRRLKGSKPVGLTAGNPGRPLMEECDMEMANDDNPQRDEGQLTVEVVTQSKLVEVLLRAAKDLEGELGQVLRSPALCEEEGDCEKSVSLVAIAEHVRNNTNRMQFALQVIEDIRRRLEL